MGLFIDPLDVRGKSRLDSIKDMETEDIELLLIRPAERRLEEAFNLDLDTDAEPRRWSSTFSTRSDLLLKFKLDMKAALLLLIDRMEENPRGHGRESVRGASVSFGAAMPREVIVLVRPWGSNVGGSKVGSLFRA